MYNEVGHLFQGLGNIQGTNTCFFTHWHEVPQGAKVAYIRIVCNICPHKKETHRVRLTGGGDKLTFDGPISTPTSDLTTYKLHWNNMVSSPGAKYLVVNVKNF